MIHLQRAWAEQKRMFKMLGLSGRRVDLLTDSLGVRGKESLRCWDGVGRELTYLQTAWAEQKRMFKMLGWSRRRVDLFTDS